MTTKRRAGGDPAVRRVAASTEFKDLLEVKRTFIVPATIFFIVYYFALPVLVGYAPAFMARPVWGPVNLAYLFALSQFFMAWILAALYVRAAGEFDRMGHRIARRGRPRAPSAGPTSRRNGR